MLSFVRTIACSIVAISILSLTTPTLAQSWQANWIGPPHNQQTRRNSWYCFRTAWSVDAVPDTFSIKIACDSKYWLWINGALVVREGGLKRGPNPTGTYFDRVDIAPHLKPGSNQIAILLWHFGKHGFSHNDSRKVGLIVDGRQGAMELQSNSTWKVMRHPGFEDANEPPPNYRLAEGNVRYDARHRLGDWQTSELNDSWPNAIELGNALDSPWGEMVERPIPQWKDYGVKDYESVVETSEDQWNPKYQATDQKKPRNVVIGKLPYNAQIHPILNVTAKTGGLKIDVQTDLVALGRDQLLRGEYITRKGTQEFEFPGWLNGHEVRYFLPDGVQVNSIQYRETGYDARFVGEFECDNERLNSLWEKSRRTLYVTMRDTYMDCPERERAQWWGDAVLEMGEAFYIFDADHGPKLAQKGILELAAFQRADGTLYSPVPSGIPANGSRKNLYDGSWSTELPRQMLASVGHYGFWNYYWHTGDRETISKVYSAVRDYLSVWELNESGLVTHRTGEWDWTDWGQHMDVAVLENAWYYLALRGAVQMADLLEKDDDATEYRRQMARIESAFNSSFWQGEFYRSPEHQGETDDRANGLAVVAGLASPEYYPAITRFLSSSFHASPYMEKYVLESLFLMNQPDAALARMLDRYASMIDSPVTTLWENFARPGVNEAGSGTYNHAWSGGPLTLMHQYVAGIEPSEPGFKRFTVRPQLGSLQYVDTKIPTRFGTISLNIKRTSNGATKIQLEVPPGTAAEIVFAGETKSLGSGFHEWTVDER